METIFKEHLENGEQLLWCGKASSDKVMDRTYSLLYCLVILISYGIAAATLFLAYKSTGELKISVVLFLHAQAYIFTLFVVYFAWYFKRKGYIEGYIMDQIALTVGIVGARFILRLIGDWMLFRKCRTRWHGSKRVNCNMFALHLAYHS